MVTDKKSRFGLGLLVGTVLGGLTALFLSPKSGKENREMVIKMVKELKKDIEKLEIDLKVREIWGEVSEEGEKIYRKARKDLLKKLDLLQDKWDELDKEKYMKMVEEVVEGLKKEMPKAADKVMELKESFVKDWNRVFKEGYKVKN